MTYNLDKKLTDTIAPTTVSSNYREFEMPPMSTVFLGSGANNKKFDFSKVLLLEGDENESVPLFVVGDENVIAKKGITSGYVVYYNASHILE